MPALEAGDVALAKQLARSNVESLLPHVEQGKKILRPAMMALKDRRRVRVGDHLTFLLENRDTVRYQVQEMMRIERIVRPADVLHEFAVYNELLPGPGQLSATLLIEYETPELRAVWLRDLLDLENHIWIEVAGTRAKASFDNRQIASDRISSVQYIKFQMSEEQSRVFSQSCALSAEQLSEVGRDLGHG